MLNQEEYCKLVDLLTEKHVFSASPPVKTTRAITVTISPGIKTQRLTALSIVRASFHFGGSLSPASRIAMRTRTTHTRLLATVVLVVRKGKTVLHTVYTQLTNILEFRHHRERHDESAEDVRYPV